MNVGIGIGISSVSHRYLIGSVSASHRMLNIHLNLGVFMSISGFIELGRKSAGSYLPIYSHIFPIFPYMRPPRNGRIRKYMSE